MTKPDDTMPTKLTFEMIAANVMDELRQHSENYGDEYYDNLVTAMKEAAAAQGGIIKLDPFGVTKPGDDIILDQPATPTLQNQSDSALVR